MTALLLAVLTASLLGSLHCAGMCGCFAALATGAPARGTLAPLAAYHAGRLVTYILAGAAAGLAGRVLDLGGAHLGVTRVSALVAIALLAGMAVVAIARAAGRSVRAIRVPRGVRSLLARALAVCASWRRVPRAGVVGLASALLPCGWLYAFLVTAAGTGSAPAGAATLAVFWIGTLPVLSAAGLGAGLFARLGRAGRAVGIAALLVLGVASVGLRAGFAVTGAPADAPPATAAEAALRAQDLDSTEAPCCHAP